MIPIDLSNKTAFVTGASRGLGKAIAARLHEAGANVAINFLDDENGANRRDAESVAAELSGERAITVPADVRRRPQLESAMDQAIERFGSLDIVVANAGVLRDRSIKKMTDEEWQTVIDTNLTGVYHTTKAASTRLANGGRIINLASISAVIGVFGQANYSAAKAAVIALTRVASRELAGGNITSNAVAPGVVMTDMGHSIPASSRQVMLSQIPLARFAEPGEVADAVLFLASPLASYITGQTIHVNGGWWG